MWEELQLKNKKAITFVAHIENHIAEMGIEGKVKCKICGKDIDEIFKEESEGGEKLKLKMWEEKGDELPFRCELDGIKGAGKTMSDALMRVFHLKGIVTDEMLRWHKREAKKELARIIFWNYLGGKVWGDAIGILERSE
jgi:hypothetical protein